MQADRGLSDFKRRFGRLTVRRALYFVVATTVVALVGCEGGSYDIVPRQQLGLVLWSAVAVGLLVGVLPRVRIGRAAQVVLVALALLGGWMFLSLLWTDSVTRTFDEIARFGIYAGLITLIVLAGNRFTAPALAAGMYAGACIVISVAVISRLSPSTFPDALEIAARFPNPDRLTFPLDYWNAVGAWAAITVVTGLAWASHVGAVRLRMLAIAPVPVAALAVYLTYSRGAVLATAVGLGALLVFSRNRWTAGILTVAAGAAAVGSILVVRARPEIADATGGAGGSEVALALAVGIALCIAAVVFAAVVRSDEADLTALVPKNVVRPALAAGCVAIVIALIGPVAAAWDEFREDDKASGADPATRLTSAGGSRSDIWSSGIDAFQSSPLTGIGPGTFEFWWLANGDDEEYLKDAHSLYIEFLAELGIPGVIFLLALLAALAVPGVAARISGRWRSDGEVAAGVACIAGGAAFLAAAAYDWVWEVTALGVLGLGALATLIALDGERISRSRRRGSLTARSGLRLGAVGLAAALAFLQVPGLVGADRIRSSERALDAGDTARASRLAEQAVDAEPWSTEARYQRARVAWRRDKLGPAADELREIAADEPGNWRWPLALVLVLAEDGRRAEARRVFEEGRKLAPLLPYFEANSGYGLLVYTTRQLREIFSEDAEK